MKLQNAVFAVMVVGWVACGPAAGTDPVVGGGSASGGGSAAAGGGSAATGGGTTAAGGGTATDGGVPGDACSNQIVVTLTPADGGTGMSGWAEADTSEATPSITPSCSAQSKDIVFKTVLPQAGQVTITATPNDLGATQDLAPVITVTTGASCVAATEAACMTTTALDSATTLTKSFSAGPIWIWISNADPANTGSPLRLQVQLQ